MCLGEWDEVWPKDGYEMPVCWLGSGGCVEAGGSCDAVGETETGACWSLACMGMGALEVGTGAAFKPHPFKPQCWMLVCVLETPRWSLLMTAIT
jgi:hypothetical protein